MSNEHYLESLSIFYDEKIKYLSKKDNFLKCKDCDLEKEFVEEWDQLTLTCGKDDKGDCGIQINIQFPRYIDHEAEILELKNKLESEVNWNVINNYIDVPENVKKLDEKRTSITNEIKTIQEKVNRFMVEDRNKTIEKFYNKRVERSEICQEILIKFNTNT